MSDLKKQEKKHYIYYSTWVFKIDAKSAGYKELMSIAKEWSKDENFYHLEIRSVSWSNLGIQFTYYDPNIEFEVNQNKDWPIVSKYKKELVEKFWSGLFARDYVQRNEKYQDRVIISKALN